MPWGQLKQPGTFPACKPRPFSHFHLRTISKTDSSMRHPCVQHLTKLCLSQCQAQLTRHSMHEINQSMHRYQRQRSCFEHLWLQLARSSAAVGADADTLQSPASCRSDSPSAMLLGVAQSVLCKCGGCCACCVLHSSQFCVCRASLWASVVHCGLSRRFLATWASQTTWEDQQQLMT